MCVCVCVCVCEQQLLVYTFTHLRTYISICFALFSVQSTVEEIWHLSQIVSSPHDLGHVTLLGHTHPGPMVHLAALLSGFTVVQPSQYHSPGLLSRSQEVGGAGVTLEDFERALLDVYSAAGLKVLPVSVYL